MRGPNDLRERIACALCARTQSVIIERYGYNTSKLAVCCSGKWKGKRLFAKILLADPYPIPPRFRAPWESASSRTSVPVRAITEQIDAEWNMTLKMLRLSGGRSVPLPLGRSLAARTIVWEEAGGTSLVRALKWSGWRSSMAEAGAEALLKAGNWLRGVHDASQEGMEVVAARDLIETVIESSRQNQDDAGHYEGVASRILERWLTNGATNDSFKVPVALTHGDFCLSNLLWNTAERQLAVIDFELSGFRPIYYDLFALVADLRAMLLNPLIPKSVIHSWEQSFWQGYGSTPTDVLEFVKALALARVFYYHFSRLLTRRQRKGWIGGINAQLYRTFLEPRIITHRLDLPRDFAHSRRS
ncbi:MAG TPA: phosphotransferase [Terriglobia bacterium]|nr:phosphotransferase [Terriglobia bacterium]